MLSTIYDLIENQISSDDFYARGSNENITQYFLIASTTDIVVNTPIFFERQL